MNSPETTIIEKVTSTLLEKFAQTHRQTQWELVHRISLKFPTYHPQGIAFAGNYIYLSSVEVLEAPVNVFDPVHSTPGRGIGHLFVIDQDGRLLHDILLGEGDMYHPGGIDFDGSKIWIPVGEYRPNANSIMFTFDPSSFEVAEQFRVKDSIGWAISDSDTGIIYGGNWGSRRFYSWSAEGEEREHWDNPSSFIDYQDCQFAGNGKAFCSGIAALPHSNSSGEYELGGIAIIDVINHRVVHETPVQVFSSAGHVITRNPFALTKDSDGLLLHVAPDDGPEIAGTELLTFKAKLK